MQAVTLQNGGTTSESNTRTYTAGTHYARVYEYSSAYSATVCYNLKVATGTASIATGIMPVTTLPSVDIYPNPVKSILNIQSQGLNIGKANIEIIGGKGERVMVQKLNAATKAVNIQSLPAGTYLLKVSDGDKVYTKRFVKM